MINQFYKLSCKLKYELDKLLCRIFGHKWVFWYHCTDLSSYFSGWDFYYCKRCHCLRGKLNPPNHPNCLYQIGQEFFAEEKQKEE